MPIKKIFITGTNTDVGKTYFATLLCDYFLNKNLSVKYIKPVQTGWPESDVEFIYKNSKMKKNDLITLYKDEKPVAPCLVFDKFPFDSVIDYIDDIKDADIVIVESAGGLMVPLDYEYYNYDIAQKANLEIMLVVPNRLGCINDTLLNYHFIKAENLNLSGFVLNNYYISSENDAQNKKIINRLTDSSVICEFDNKLLYFKG